MPVENAELVDAENGASNVLGLLNLCLPGQFLWHVEDLLYDQADGVAFRAFKRKEAESDESNVASITIIDATSDVSEPDISKISAADVADVDRALYEGTLAQYEVNGRTLVKWMSSHLNESDSLKGLVTAYIERDGTTDMQVISFRARTKNKNVVIIGAFNIAEKDTLAVPIFAAMRNIVFLV